MAFRLSPRALEAGHRLSAFETIGSTNAEALARGRAGEAGPLWVVSDHQTAGRGRRGNAWETPRGNLAASLLGTTDAPPAVAATLGFVAGLAVRSALERVAPGLNLRLKWPNDVLADGGKLAGILLETETVAQDHRTGARDQRIVAVGLGVNVAASPVGLRYSATSLAERGRAVTADELFEALSEAWLAFHRLWDHGRGMPQIRALWLEAAAGVGEPIAVRLGDEAARGVFETIDTSGQLILRSSDGTVRAIAAGEVHFGAAATAWEVA
jgi:BirA family transcriptional regulator, biotin operon repressor / biotin---[acetyl-CoA-carboxylase] ligase